MSFSYNDEGLRVTKTVNGVTTNYYYQGSVLYAEETDEAVIVYIYDQNGSPMGFQYHGADYADGVWDGYAYEKNMFGDIVAVYDVSTGLKLISYTYDAWGTCTKTTYYNSGDTTSAINNPYRYRGYYYDEDLCMYYLQSRYYDPTICRFINADGYASTGQGLTGYNMFAYCGNNPVMYVDYTGKSPIFIALIVLIVINIKVVRESEEFVQNNDIAPMDDERYLFIEGIKDGNDIKNDGNTSGLSKEEQLAYVRRKRQDWNAEKNNEWSEADMMREIAYHVNFYHLLECLGWQNCNLASRPRYVDYEDQQDFRTYLFRFIFNPLAILP